MKEIDEEKFWANAEAGYREWLAKCYLDSIPKIRLRKSRRLTSDVALLQPWIIVHKGRTVGPSHLIGEEENGN